MKTLVTRAAPIAILALSALCLAAAPLLMPESYSVLANTTSESGAQGVDGAWLARLGFLLFGLGAIGVTLRARASWPIAATCLHFAFSVFMVGAAAFSTRSWILGAYDVTENTLHTIAATGMGFAFAFGVLAVLLRARHRGNTGNALHAIALATATLLPMAMSMFDSIDGALQRCMFAIAYLWYVREAMRSRQCVPDAEKLE